jgi:hypothetical protein
VRRGEEQHGGRDVPGLAEPAHRDALHERALAGLAAALPLPLGVGLAAHEAGRHGVDGDAVLAELMRELAHEAELRGLRRRAALDAGEAHAEPGARGDHHDAARAPALHHRDHRARGKEGALDVDVLDRVPRRLARLLNRLRRLPEDAARDMDEDVGLARRGDQLRPGVGVGHVEPMPRDRGRHRGELLDEDVGRDDGGAALAEGGRDRSADPVRGAGPQHALATEADCIAARVAAANGLRYSAPR